MSIPQATRLKLEVVGAVQGVGFRPFIYRLASEHHLNGWVVNDARGVFVEVEGPRSELERFLMRLPEETPPRAVVHHLRSSWAEAVGYPAFEIRESEESGRKSAVVLPEVAVCADCLREVFDPGDRRFRYPFTNCTNCGPRFSIVRRLPYDRPNTSMSGFTMCEACRREYDDPLDRRFHAQPNACPDCGPRLELCEPGGARLAEEDQALVETAAALRSGRIVAVKGLGGFHLMADAASAGAVARLRRRKGRPDKPLALMAADLEQLASLCEVPAAAADLLAGPEAPILLLLRRAGAAVAHEVAPGNPRLGVMLPYTPLHHLLLREVGAPLVATSGNLSDEPICTDNREAMERLGGIADLFLLHDRPIVRHVDDSVVVLDGGRPLPLRRARGFAPLPLLSERPLPSVLAVGAHFKNVVALSVERNVFLSQHVGDMETPQAEEAFERVIADFLELYEARPETVAHDLHPAYWTTEWARRAAAGELRRGGSGSDRLAELAGVGRLAVQHHHAHLASCLADREEPGPALGVTWDGTGQGTDGTVWGGEFLRGDAAGFVRVASLRPFRLPGGEAAVREPRRVALALLWEMSGESALERTDLPALASLTEGERRLLGRMLQSGLRSPLTTSAGRLFDGVAALVGLHPRVSFEGQAAMALEFAADPGERGVYPLPAVPERAAVELSPEAESVGERQGEPLLRLDWEPLLQALLEDLRRGVDAGRMAARFHNSLAAAIVAVARAVGEPVVALSGGCFQNLLLTEGAAAGLEGAGFRVLTHRRVPPNDGGLCLGQVAVAAVRTTSEGER